MCGMCCKRVVTQATKASINTTTGWWWWWDKLIGFGGSLTYISSPPNEKIPDAVVVAVSVASVSVSVTSVVTAVSVGSTGFVVAGLAGPGIGAWEL